MKATSVREAFEMAFRILGEGMEKGAVKDEDATERAGYPIYRSIASPSEWVSDLGNRLEVNKANGETVVIWIEEVTEEKNLVIIENDTVKGEFITSEEYNAKISELGWVVRYAFGKWVVCDGKAPENIIVKKGEIFIGNPLKWCDTMQQADTLCNFLNA